MPESTATAAEIAARDTAYDTHFLAIEGLPYVFFEDETDELLGSGAGSWIGESEDALGQTQGRIGLPGLVLPRSFREAMDPKTGDLESQSVTIRLVDYEGILASLFAKEGKTFDVLAQDIQPGTSALPTSVIIAGGGTTNPRGQYIGLERIGPAGERGFFSPFTFSLIGRHHVYNAYGTASEGPPPVTISDSPLDFLGRKFAIYRIVRRNVSRPSDWQAWPLWDDQVSAPGCMVAWGELEDRGAVAGNREWDLKARGARSLLERTLNQWAPGWSPISDAVIELTDAQRQIAIRFEHNGGDGPDLSVGWTTVLSASGDKDTWIAEITAFIQDVASGTTSSYGTNPVEDFNNAGAGVLVDGTFYVQRDPTDHTTYLNSGGVGMGIGIHEIVWRELGFDPPLQMSEPPFADERGIDFRSLAAGENGFGWDAVGAEAPCEGMWIAALNTITLGADGGVYTSDPSYDDNGGNPRYWMPSTAGSPVILRGPNNTPQTIRLGFDQPYLEGVQSVPRTDADVLGSPVDQARYFAIRGKRFVGTPAGAGWVYDEAGNPLQYESVEAEDFATLMRGSWTAAGYGQLVEEDGRPTLVLERYEHPGLAGVPFQPLDGEWAAANTPDAPGLEIAPLMTYGYGQAMALGRTIECFYQLLLSTGTAAGYATDESTDPAFVDGANSHAAQAEPWCVDALRADHGLAVPNQLVADPDTVATEFDRVPGGKSGPLNRVGLAYVGPQQSLDVLASMLRPRGLAWSLDGDQYGLVYLAPFGPDDATVTIGEDDLYGQTDNPETTIPKQQLRAMGQLDRVELKQRYNPIDGETLYEQTYRARDAEAQARRGDLELELTEHGLVPGDWKVPGTQAWGNLFRQLWEIERSEFFARRHFLVTGLCLNRITGRSCHVGTRVRLTNPWPVNPAGTEGNADAQGYGLTDACGIILERDYDRAARSYTVSVLVFAGQGAGPHLFMPIGKVASTSAAAVTMEAEDETLGLSGASRFAMPSWSSNAVQARVRFLSHDRVSWYLSSVYTISSVAGDVVTLTGSPTASDVYRDRDVYMVMAEYGQQAGSWVTSYGSPIVLDTLAHPGGQGTPLEP